MASVLAHALGAGVVWEAGRRLGEGWVPQSRAAYLIPAAVGVAPDLDVLLAMLSGPGAGIAHRGPSHSLVFGLALSAIAAAGLRWAWRKRPDRPDIRRTFAVLFACTWVHPVLDYAMGCGPPVPFLWPFVDRGWLSPIQFIPTAYYSTSPGGLLAVAVHPRTWSGIGLEAVSLVPLWVAARVRARKWTALALAISACGFGLTVWLYR